VARAASDTAVINTTAAVSGITAKPVNSNADTGG
jgi:hypothetical protein